MPVLFRIALFVLILFATSTSPAIGSKHTVKTTPSAPAGSNESHHSKTWRFTLPKGDAVKGRAAFEKFECYYCHRLRGEDFPDPVESAPELSQMGPMHPPEFFAESIMNPNVVVPKQYRQHDGSSPMTNFAQKMTVQELVDLSSYIASLKPDGGPRTVSGEGQVVAVAHEAGEIVLAHQALNGFMQAMTMGYKVSSASLLKAVKPGDTVQFTIDTEKRVITKITKAPAAGERNKG